MTVAGGSPTKLVAGPVMPRAANDCEFFVEAICVARVAIACMTLPIAVLSCVNSSNGAVTSSMIGPLFGFGTHCLDDGLNDGSRPPIESEWSTWTSNPTPSGTLSTPSRTIQSITRTYSEKPPPAGSNPAVMPTFMYAGHCAYSLRSQ